MPIRRQSKLTRAIMAMVCACVLVSMPVMAALRAAHPGATSKSIGSGQAAALKNSKLAAGVPCHGGGPVADLVEAVRTETYKFHHHFHDNGLHVPGQEIATPLPIQDGSSDSERAANELFSCCVPGCGLAILAAGLRIAVGDTRPIRYALPANQRHAELRPAMPAEPPRTIDIAVLAA